MTDDEDREVVNLYVITLTTRMLDAGILMADYRTLGVDADRDVERLLASELRRSHPEDALECMEAFYRAAADICEAARDG